MPRKLLSLTHVAERVDLDPRTVHKLVAIGHLPKPVKQFGMYFWFEDDIEMYLRQLELGTLPPPKPLPKKGEKE